MGLIFLKLGGFYFYNKDLSETELDFSPETVSNFEIVSQEKLRTQIKSFAENYNLKPQNVTILLSDELVFKKTLISEEEIQKNDEVQKFLDEIPLDKSKLIKKEITADGEMKIFATSKDFYSAISETFNTLGWKIEAIVPISRFGTYDPKASLSQESLKQILEKSHLFQSSSFLTNETPDSIVSKTLPDIQMPEEEPQTQTSFNQEKAPRKSPPILLILGVLFILAALLFTGYSIFFANKTDEEIADNNRTAEVIITPQATSEPEKEATKSATPSAKLERDKIKIQVLNGTGTQGQAAKVRDRLLKLGYKEIEVGNASTSDFTDSEVVFTKSLASSARDEIFSELKKVFQKVTIKDASGSAKFDAVVTTGKEL